MTDIILERYKVAYEFFNGEPPMPIHCINGMYSFKGPLTGKILSYTSEELKKMRIRLVERGLGLDRVVPQIHIEDYFKIRFPNYKRYKFI